MPMENFQPTASNPAANNLFIHAYSDLLPRLASAAPRELPASVNFSSDIYGKGIDSLPPATADQLRPIFDKASGVSFSTPAENAKTGQQPDFFLGEDGKLRANPEKKTPNKDGSINVELQTKNKTEVDGKKLADKLQKAAIKDLINYFTHNNKGQKVPQDWLDQLSKEPDLPPAPVPIDTPQPEAPVTPPTDSSPQPTPQPGTDASSQPAPQQSAPSDSGAGGGGGSSGGGGGGSSGGGGGGDSSAGGGGGGSSGGGGGRDSSAGGGGSAPSGGGDSTISNAPTANVSDLPPLKDVPSPTPNGGGLAHLQEAIARANSGGAPISVLQYGDSHVAGGTEPKAIEDALKSLGPVQYDTMAKVGISANYPLTDPTNWLNKPIQKDHPDLVILSFGSNDSAGNVNQAAYEQSYQKLIDNVRERDPNASILIVGPSDGDSITGANKGNTLPGLDNVVAAQKAVAEKNGLDFFDLRQSMGGPGSIEDWHSKGLAADDKLHFTTKGYELIGNAVANHIKDQVHK